MAENQVKPRAHADIIKQWADGASIQYRKDANSKWVDSPDPAWVSDYEYRVKPEKMYPKTKMDDQALFRVYTATTETNVDSFRAIANAALRHAIDAGQVVTREEFDRVTTELKGVDKAFRIMFGEAYRPGMVYPVKKP